MSLWFKIACQFILIDHKFENMPKHTFYKHFHTNSLSTLQSKYYLDKGSESTSLLGLAVCLHKLQCICLCWAELQPEQLFVSDWALTVQGPEKNRVSCFLCPKHTVQDLWKNRGKDKKGSEQKVGAVSPTSPSFTPFCCWSCITTKMDRATGLQFPPALNAHRPHIIGGNSS